MGIEDGATDQFREIHGGLRHTEPFLVGAVEIHPADGRVRGEHHRHSAVLRVEGGRLKCCTANIQFVHQPP